MTITKAFFATVCVLALIIFGSIYSGLYPMGADDPHNRVTHWALETLREHSIKRSARDIVIPDLNDSALLLAGGPDYNEMCSGCHLKPGIKESDLSIGLYPSPPNLASASDEHGHDHDHDESIGKEEAVRRNFWIIKHGIKASGMPAWGATHDDERIWAMVAFINKLPTLSSDHYQILTSRPAGDANDHH